jgi:hypothetical protein
VTSPRAIAANRANAGRSTGPRTARGKATARRNALRHGFAAGRLARPEDCDAVRRIARQICGDSDMLRGDQATVIAECHLLIRRLRAARAAAVARLDNSPASLRDLLSIDRYERRAIARRRRAINQLAALCTQGDKDEVKYNLRIGLAERSQSPESAPGRNVAERPVPHHGPRRDAGRPRRDPVQRRGPREPTGTAAPPS